MENITLSSVMIAGNSSLNDSFPTIVQQSDELYYVGDDDNRDSLYLVIPITIIYVLIFITGCIGNIATCIVIARNRSMYSATNYYLFSLAVSDFMLLISGVPMELYHIWYKNEFMFGEAFCIIRNMINEMSANATVLTITAFTIERYFAICHPFLAHTMSKLSRAIKYIFLIWILSISFAVPQALQTGIVLGEGDSSWCTVVEERVWLEHSFEFATVLFFFAPMSLITVLYILIGVKLRSSTMIKRENGSTVQRNNNLTSNTHQNANQSTKRVLKMLVAVVICFFLCWAPFHAQRLVYMWAMNYMGNPTIRKIFVFTTYASGILYYVSAIVNPLLYNIMSNKFRAAFKETLQKKCCYCAPSTHANDQKRQYRILSRGQRRYGQHESSEYSAGSGKDEYSSATQKQSIDTIAASRNTSLKQYKLNSGKGFSDMSIKSPSLGPNAACFGNGNEHACVSARVTSSNINIVSDCNINQIHLNIFPPSATYTKEPQSTFAVASGSSQAEEISRGCLNIDVHEKVNAKSGTESGELKRKMSSGYFSHISLKRNDSFLHISIGNSSKITKRHKRNSWLFANLWKFSRKRKPSSHRNIFFSPQITKDGVYRLSNRSLNLVNDELMISINKRDYGEPSTSADTSMPTNDGEGGYVKHLRLIERDLSGTFPYSYDDAELENGANELDCYMNEIKRREMR